MHFAANNKMAERSTPSCVDYWDDFYSEGGPGYVDTYEWYLLYPDIRPFLVANLPAEGQRILHIGSPSAIYLFNYFLRYLFFFLILFII